MTTQADVKRSALATKVVAGPQVKAAATAVKGLASAEGAPAAGAPSAPPALLALLNAEAEVRQARSVGDLVLVMANETRKLTRARQVFVVLRGVAGAAEVRGVSSMPSVDRNTPLVSMIEDVVRNAAQACNGPCRLPIEDAADAATAKVYPFTELHWEPLCRDPKNALGGLILAREEAWTEVDLIVAKRLAATYTHALEALTSQSKSFKSYVTPSKRWPLAVFGLALIALMLIKVPMKALAPAEIIPRDGAIIAAPIDGIIEQVLVEPNQPVTAGQTLVKLNDTTLRSRFDVAERDVQVGEARFKQANQIAFSDSRGMHELGIARAELDIKIAERNFAAEMLSKSEIKSLKDGIALYADRRELVGKPVAVGERILEVADPAMVEVRIDLPVADAIALAPGSAVRVFLDSDPLHARVATIKRSDYKARLAGNDVLSFRITAALTPDKTMAVPRIGVRGTAQVSGDDVALGFFVFRRPITALRQWIGL